MRFVAPFAVAAFAVGAIAKVTVHQPGTNFDKYAGERGYAGHEDPHKFAHGGVHAREADADAIEAWEGKHDGKAPSYQAHGGVAHGGYSSHHMARSEPWEHSGHKFNAPASHYGGKHFARDVEDDEDEDEEFDDETAEIVARSIEENGDEDEEAEMEARSIPGGFEGHEGKFGPGKFGGRKGHVARSVKNAFAKNGYFGGRYDEHGVPQGQKHHMARDAYMNDNGLNGNIRGHHGGARLNAREAEAEAEARQPYGGFGGKLGNDFHGRPHVARDAEARQQYGGFGKSGGNFEHEQFGGAQQHRPHQARDAAYGGFGKQGGDYKYFSGAEEHRPHHARDAEAGVEAMKAAGWLLDEPHTSLLSKASHSMASAWSKPTGSHTSHPTGRFTGRPGGHVQAREAAEASRASHASAAHSHERQHPSWTKSASWSKPTAAKTPEPKSGWFGSW